MTATREFKGSVRDVFMWNVHFQSYLNKFSLLFVRMCIIKLYIFKSIKIHVFSNKLFDMHHQ